MVLKKSRYSNKALHITTRGSTVYGIYLLDGGLGDSEACQHIHPAAGEYNRNERGHSVF